MSNQRGFTLIELMLATTLTVLLMAGVLTVITTLRKPLPEPAQRGDAPPVDASVLAALGVIEADLYLATQIDSEADELTLQSFGALDAESSDRGPRPVDIVYRIVEVDGEPWLLREQTRMDTKKPMAPRRELVGSGITRIQLDPPSPLMEEERSYATDHSRGEAEGNGERFASVDEGMWRLRLWADEADDPVIDRDIPLRRSLIEQEEEEGDDA